MPKQTPAVRLFELRERLRMSLWLVPAVGVLLAATMAAALTALDHELPEGAVSWISFGGGAESARNLLSVIAGSMATSISLIFSVTMVVLQLASAQYSPRVLRTFIRDRLVQLVLASYLGTFVYCLLVLPSVRAQSTDSEEFVPALAVSTALVLALWCLALFVRYVHHVAHAIRASTIVATVARETRSSLEHMYPDAIGDPAPPAKQPVVMAAQEVCWPGEPGVLVAVDDHALMRWAVRLDAVVEVVAVVGEFIPTGATMMRLQGDNGGDGDALLECFTVGDERTMSQDPAFGFRQIVDIAERALSPGVNDPTTAVQAIDQLHDLLRRLVARDIPSPLRVDDNGTLRVIAPRLDWDDYVDLAFDEIRHYSGRSLQVSRRLLGAIDDLVKVAPPHRRPILETQRTLIEREIQRQFDDPHDRHRGMSATKVS